MSRTHFAPDVCRFYSHWCQNLSLLSFSILCLSPVAMFFTHTITLTSFIIVESFGFVFSIALAIFGACFVSKAQSDNL